MMRTTKLIFSLVLLFFTFSCEESDVILADDDFIDLAGGADEPGQGPKGDEINRDVYKGDDGKYYADITYGSSGGTTYIASPPSFRYSGPGSNSGSGGGVGGGIGSVKSNDLGVDHIDGATGLSARSVNIELIKFCTKIGSARITGITLRFRGRQDGSGLSKSFDHTYFITLSKYLNQGDNRYYIYSDKARQWIGEACDYAYEMLGSNQIRYESMAAMQKGNKRKFRDYLQAGLRRRMPGSIVDMTGTKSNYSKCSSIPTRIN